MHPATSPLIKTMAVIAYIRESDLKAKAPPVEMQPMALLLNEILAKILDIALGFLFTFYNNSLNTFCYRSENLIRNCIQILQDFEQLVFLQIL